MDASHSKPRPLVAVEAELDGLAGGRDGWTARGEYLSAAGWIAARFCPAIAGMKKGVLVEGLDSVDVDEDAWNEVVGEDRHVGPAEVAAIRIDFAAWLRLLPR
jgi:hypothetical protein